ncbi:MULTISPECIES: IclR family transcriptional regulator [Sporosarcina]|uniref:IclR family transcriptional regulator n=1 Tax=Sporosarcina TaxID=1569 RepID=UPI000590CA3E|nr:MULTISPECIES: IclR family transcriptional regulator [Sporosarcina]WJY27746.1 IclR family transcriptional regulator [Sporosarcina sp. 0.2-SM1T-5]
MIQSIDRAMKLIEALSADGKDLWLAAELAEETELPISTVYRITQSLLQHGLIIQDETTKQFSLGYRWMELGLKMFEKLDVRDITRPVLEQLAAGVEETVYLNIPRGDYSMIIERIDSPKSVKIQDSVGARIPLHIGGANKAILANLPSTEVQKILKRLVSDEQKRAELLEVLAVVKQQGYGISYGEKTKGTIAVGAPVFDFEGRPVGAISAEVLAYDFKEERLDSLIEQVCAAARQVTAELSGAQHG